MAVPVEKPVRFVHPPLGKTVASQYPTPLIADLVIIVAKEVNAPSYQVEQYETPHPDSEKYPNHKLSLIQLSEDGLKAKWFYVADRDNQDLYNYALKFSSEFHAAPIYIRQYVLPRDTYEPLDNGTPDSANAGALLVHEEVTGPADGELASLYIKVIRVFETLPGPFVATTRLDVDGVVVTVNTRRNIAADITTGEDITTGVWSKTTKKGEDSYVADEIVESRAIPGIAMLSTKIDDDGKVVSKTQQYIATADKVSEETLVDGVWTHEYITDVDGTRLVSWQWVETRDVPGNPVEGDTIEEDGATLRTVRILKAIGDITPSESIADGLWTKVEAKEVGDLVAQEVTITRPVPGNPVPSTRLDDDGVEVDIVTTLKDTTTITTEETLTDGIWSKTTKKAVSDLVAQEIVETRAIPGNPVPSSKVDPDGAVVSIVATLKDTTTITPSETLIDGVWTETSKEGVSDLVAKEMVMSRAIPGNAMTLTKIEEDGKVLTTSRILAAQNVIVSAEAIVGGATWTRTYQEDPPVFRGFAIKGGDLVAWKIVESRPVPGNAMQSTRLDPDGVEVDVTTTLKQASTITTEETLVANVWSKTTKKEVSDLVAQEIVETRAVPGNPMVTTRVEEDGTVTTITKTLGDTSTIVSGEVIDTGFWIKTRKEEVSDLVAYQVQEVRAIPGNAVVSTKIDEDGKTITITKTLKDTSTITSSEAIVTGVWTRKYKEPVSDLVANEVAETRPVPGNVVTSTDFERDGVTKTVSKQLIATADVDTSEVLASNLLTRNFGEAVTDLVSHQIIEVITVAYDSLLDLPSLTTTIPIIFPERFKASIPTHVESHIVEGAPAEPALVAGEFEHSERALTPFYKEVRSTLFDIDTFPTLAGQTYDEHFDVVLPYTEDIEPSGTGIGVARTTVEPIGGGYELDKTPNISAITVLLDTYSLSFPGTKAISLPPVLESVNSTIEKNRGDGSTSTPYSVAFWSGHGAYSIPVSAGSQASATIIAKVVPIISEARADRVNTLHFMFFLPSPVSASDVSTKLAALLGSSVSSWPTFHLKSAAVFSIGQRQALRVSCDTHNSNGGSSDSCEGAIYSSNSVSSEVGLLVETTHIPPTIHGDLTISGSTTDSETLIAEADASIGGNFGTCAMAGVTNFRHEEGTVNASIYSIGLEATSPAVIPSSGYYLLGSDAEPYKYGYVSVHAEVFDASLL